MKRKVKYTRVPKGKTKRIIYRKKGKQPVCASCGKKLHGVPKSASSKTKRRPERAHPGLCSSCARERIRGEILRE